MLEQKTLYIQKAQKMLFQIIYELLTFHSLFVQNKNNFKFHTRIKDYTSSQKGASEVSEYIKFNVVE